MHIKWPEQYLRFPRIAVRASDIRALSQDPLTQWSCSPFLLPSSYIQPSCGLDSSGILRALRYGVHLGSEIPLLSGLVRPFFDADV